MSTKPVFSGTRGFPPQVKSADRIDRSLLSIVDSGLASVVLGVPWFMGGRHPLGELVLVTIAVAVALAWALRQAISRNATAWARCSAELLIVAGAGLLLLQITPLPQSALGWLAPHTATILPLWTPGSGEQTSLGTWTQVSLTPQATRAALALFLAYALVFVVCVQRVRSVADVEKILGCMALASVLLAIVGLLQYLAGNGKFLWVYQHPFRDTYTTVVGPFINRNHFAHLLALGLGPLLWSIQRCMNQRQQNSGNGGFSKAPPSQRHQWALIARLIGLGLVLFAGLMSLSRGGAAMMFLSAAICLAAFYRRSLLSKKFALAIVGVFALIGGCLVIHGYQTVTNRLADYTRGSLADLDANAGRRKIWEADAKALPDYAALGSGVGSHRDVYPMYFSEYSETEYTHAESGYLQVALEAGLPGITLLLVGIALCGYWCLSGMRRAPDNRHFVCAAAVTASLAVSAVHSTVDFVWYIPACMAATVLATACSFRLAALARQRAEVQTAPRASRLTCALVAACVAVLGTWMVANRLAPAMASPYWDRYLTYALSADGKASEAFPASIVADLEEIVRWDPNDAPAHVRLAGECLRHFDQAQKTSENAMALNQIRDAAIASRFSSRKELDQWLSRAVGEARHDLDSAIAHAWHGLSLAPLQGEAYVYLAELCFLQGASPAAKRAYIEQALKVRPHNGKVLFAAGNEAALAGNLNQALLRWKQAFKSGPEEQAKLIDLFAANRVPVAFVLQGFEPDLPALRLMHAKYAQLQTPTELRQLLVYYARVGQAAAAQAEENQAAQLYLELHSVYRDLNDPEKTLDCLRRSVAIRPNDYDIQLAMGIYLSEQQQFEEAEQNLNWCAQRRPEDPQVKAALAAAVKGRIERTSRPSLNVSRLR